MSENDKVTIVYPPGSGGQWLSTVIHALETQRYVVPHTNVNFHDVIIYPKTKSFVFDHRMRVPGKYISLHGEYSNFIIYVNEYYKFRIREPKAREEYNKKTPLEQFFHQSNNAYWRITGDAALEYPNIKFNHDLIFTDPKKFTQQLYQVLDEHTINYTPNDNFMLEAIDSYVQSCRHKDFLGDFDNSCVWPAWCHALCLYHCVNIPINVSTDYNGFIEFLRSKQQQFVDLTVKNNIV